MILTATSDVVQLRRCSVDDGDVVVVDYGGSCRCLFRGHQLTATTDPIGYSDISYVDTVRNILLTTTLF